MEQGNNQHWHRMMELAESNHTAAIFFLGWLSQPVSEDAICQAMKVYNDVNDIARISDPFLQLEAMLRRFQPPTS